MPVLAGQIVTADQLNRMQPKTYDAAGTTDLVGPVSDVDVPGATITLVTTTPNAVVVVETIFDFNLSSTTAVVGSGRLNVDGVGESRYAIFQQGPGTASDRSTCGQNYRVVLPATGSHTLKLTATVPVNMGLTAVYTSLVATVYEVV